MVTTISVSEKTKKELDKLKIDLGRRSMDALLKEMLIETKRRKFENASELFRGKLREKGLTIKDIQREGTRVRKEIYSEQFK